MAYSLDDVYTDDEFRRMCEALTSDEFVQLQENIITEGRIRDPIVVWHDGDGCLLLDGHHRLAIWNSLPPESTVRPPTIIEAAHVQDRQDAIAWIAKNQLGRRNLTVEQRRVLIGKLYNARKSNGRAAEGEADRIAEEYDVSPRTVRRAGQYVDAMDNIAETNPEFVQEAEGRISHDDAVAVAQMAPREQKSAIDTLEKQLKSDPKAKPRVDKKGTKTQRRTEYKGPFTALDDLMSRMIKEVDKTALVLDDRGAHHSQVMGKLTEVKVVIRNWKVKTGYNDR